MNIMEAKMTTPAKRVSIIVVTYNHAKNIAKCLDSLIEQDTGTPYEIIVADDASTDGTSQILRDYAERHPDLIIPIIQDKNLGPGPNFQSALELAKSEYIAYCDGDDYWCHRKKLDTAIKTLDNNPDCTVFVHNTNMHDISSGSTTPIVTNNWTGVLKDKKFSLAQSQYTHISARVFRNTSFPNLGDTFMYHFLLTKGKGYYHDEIMSVYNYDKTGVWSRLSKEQQKNENYKLFQLLNDTFDYKYDAYYTGLMPRSLKLYKLLLGKKRGWNKFIKQHASS